MHNVGKNSKKRGSEGTSAPPAKRGRPAKTDNPVLQRYPPLEVSTDDGKAAEALGKELEKEKPRKDVVLRLSKDTFTERRQYILSTQTSVAEIIARYKALSLPYMVSFILLSDELEVTKVFCYACRLNKKWIPS